MRCGGQGAGKNYILCIKLIHNKCVFGCFPCSAGCCLIGASKKWHKKWSKDRSRKEKLGYGLGKFFKIGNFQAEQKNAENCQKTGLVWYSPTCKDWGKEKPGLGQGSGGKAGFDKIVLRAKKLKEFWMNTSDPR